MVIIKLVPDTDKYLDKTCAYLDKVMKGKAKLPKTLIKEIVMTPEIFAKIFSPARIRLILRLKKNKIKNIYQLAKELNRKYEAVYRDIKYLEGMGIIKIKTKDKKKIPYIDEPITIPSFSV
ncbi:hypothetical protein ACFL0W_02845 [Nanoarchaeota archaeon]